MPVMEQPETEEAKDFSEKFKAVYQEAGQPKVTFLINEKLSARDGWESTQRLRISGSSQYDGVKLGEVNSGKEESEAIFIVETKEKPLKIFDSKRLSFILSGFFSGVQELNVQVIDKNTIHEIEKLSNSEALESSLLLSSIQSFSDLLSEIHIFNQNQGSVAAELRIIDVETGRLLAQTTVELDGSSEYETYFKATSKGYVKEKRLVKCKNDQSESCHESMSDRDVNRGKHLAEIFSSNLAKGLSF